MQISEDNPRTVHAEILGADVCASQDAALA
jgi:hypothetical protein